VVDKLLPRHIDVDELLPLAIVKVDRKL